MNWPVLGGGVAAAIVLAGIALRLRRGRKDASINDPEAAAHAAEQSLAGFAAHGAIVGDDGGAALVVANDARMAVVKRRGARMAVREVTPRMLVATAAGVRVQTGERRFGNVLLVGIDSLDVRRLVPSLTHV